MVLRLLPLVAAVGVLVVLALAPASRSLDRVVSSFAYSLFRGDRVPVDTRRKRQLRAGGIGTPYRLYVTKTRLHVAVGAAVGSIIGVYAATALLATIPIAELTFPGGAALRRVPSELRGDSVKRFVVFLGAAVSMGGLSGAIVNAVRWQIPVIRAGTRRRQIDAMMPRMVAFVYALSRGGMSYPDVMRSLAANRGVFGAVADEVAIGVRDIDLFGADVITSVQNIADRTPSEQFQRFNENLTSVLRSGQDLSGFLREQYEQYREQAREQQEEILEVLATAAEMYVTLVVAGMLFLLTILLIIGLTSGGTLVLIRLITYLLLPGLNLLFIAYLLEVTQPLRVTRDTSPDLGHVEGDTVSGGPVPGDGSATTTLADGGLVTPRTLGNRNRLRAYRRIRRIRTLLSRPLSTLLDEPTALLVLTVPLAVLFVLVRLPSVLAGGFSLSLFDDVLVQATLFVFGTFAVAYGASQRRLRRREGAVPDLLDRLADLNEAGVSVVSSFERVRRTDVGALTPDVEQIWQDIRWGATVEQALARFEERVETPAVTRTVTLVTNAMAASNDIGPVLRIAADQARSERRLKRQRRQEMLTYLVVIYIAFVVFLVVIATIDTVLIPNLPTAASVSPSVSTTSVSTGGLSLVGITQERIDQYRLVFFHAVLIQSLLSGLIAGLMAWATLKAGVKHAAVMLAITYAVFLVL